MHKTATNLNLNLNHVTNATGPDDEENNIPRFATLAEADAAISDFVKNIDRIADTFPTPYPTPPAPELLKLLHAKLQGLFDESMSFDINSPSDPRRFAKVEQDLNIITDKAEELENLLKARVVAKDSGVRSSGFSPLSLPPNPTAGTIISTPSTPLTPSNTTEHILSQPLPTKNETQPEASQTPATSQPEASQNPAESQPQPSPTPDATRIFEATADPRSPLDALPIEDQELLFDILQTHGIRPSIPLLAKPRQHGGLGKTFTRSALTSFLPRFRQRRAKTHRALARETCLGQLGHIGADTTGPKLATAHLVARLTDTAFEPDLSEAAMSRVIMNLHRLQSADAANRRLELAEIRTLEKRADEIFK